MLFLGMICKSKINFFLKILQGLSLKKTFIQISNNNTNKLGLVCEVPQELEMQICKSDPEMRS